MNETTTTSAGLSAGASPHAPKPNVNIQIIDNGFLVSYWDNRTGNHQFHCQNLGLVKDQLESIFDPN